MNNNTYRINNANINHKNRYNINKNNYCSTKY